jgi:hypothetical protein
MVYSNANIPLDFHRVKVVCDGSKNASANWPVVSWYALEVMR